jgi:DNA (cytosine-5)-methyltransferase 3A
MNVLSLFDGMACGMLAMESAGIEVDRYVAFEIDKYAVQTSSHNFPMIEHRGDVFQADFTEFYGFDFLVGGSPCTYWSIAQKNNRETEASGMGWELFSQYVRALKEAQPMYFIYENNKSMANAIRDSITETFGFEPICINSALVSAQNRQRLYWVGKRNPDGTYSRVKVDQPEDREILLRDVLDGVTDRQKGRCVLSSIGRTTTREYFTKDQGTMVFEPVAINTTAAGDKARTLMAGYYKYGTATLITNEGFTGGTTAVAEPVAITVININPSGKGINGAVGRIDAKSRCLTTNKGEGQKIIVPVSDPFGIGYRGRMEDGKWVKRYESNGEPKANAITTAQTDSMVALPVSVYARPVEWDDEGKPTKAISGADGKTYTVFEVKDGLITIKGKQYPIKLEDGFYIIRKLTVSECKRLQTVPEWYEFPVSDTQAYKMLGNGWTVEVISHILSFVDF